MATGVADVPITSTNGTLGPVTCCCLHPTGGGMAMDADTRKAVEERAYVLWDEAGRPDGSALLYWLRAEEELGRGGAGRHFMVTLQELAAEAHALEKSEAFASGSAAAGLGRQGCPDCRTAPWPGRREPDQRTRRDASRKGRCRCLAPRQSRVATRCLGGTKGRAAARPRGARTAEPVSAA